MSQERLDKLVATLARTRPVLDDLTRARVAAVVQAVGHAPQPVRRSVLSRRWVIGAAAAAAAMLATGLFLRGSDAVQFVVPDTPMVVTGELPEGAMLSAVPGTTVRGELAGTVLTVHGPGWATRRGSRIVVDADALIVDRPGADTLVELKVRTATIRTQHATFSVDATYALRVTVIRGEILLSCDGDVVDQSVTAGGSVSCGPARTATDQPRSTEPPSPRPSLSYASPAASGAVLADTLLPSPQASIPGASATTGNAPSPALQTTAARTPAAPHATVVARTSPPPAQNVAAADASLPPRAMSADAVTPSTPSTQPPLVDAQHTAPAEPAAPSIPAPDSIIAGPITAARYAAVEQLMAKDPAAARAALRALVAEAPTAPEAAPALLDLARLAAAAGDDVAAQVALSQLAAHPGAAAFAMPTAYLRCVLERDDPGRRTCLAGFRAAFPDSPRDADVLAHLAVATARVGDCHAALPLLAEYTRRYPNRHGAADVRAWSAHCEAAGAP